MSGCEEVRDLLLASARGEAISTAGRSFLREHLECCAECGRRLANERRLSAGLAAMASTAAALPRPHVKSALLAEFRRQQKVVPMRGRWAAIAAMAAMLLPGVFYLLTRSRGPAVVVVKPAEIAKPVETAVVKNASPAAVAPARPVHRRRVRRSPVPPAEPAEVASDFFEIPYSEPLRPEERADLIRIRVPRASMAVFGLPVPGGRLDSEIQADVLRGEDGVARAVRFIR